MSIGSGGKPAGDTRARAASTRRCAATMRGLTVSARLTSADRSAVDAALVSTLVLDETALESAAAARPAWARAGWRFALTAIKNSRPPATRPLATSVRRRHRGRRRRLMHSHDGEHARTPDVPSRVNMSLLEESCSCEALSRLGRAVHAAQGWRRRSSNRRRGGECSGSLRNRRASHQRIVEGTTREEGERPDARRAKPASTSRAPAGERAPRCAHAW